MPPKDPKTTAAKRKNTDETADPPKKRGRPTKKNPHADAPEGSNNDNGRKDVQIDPSSLAEDEAAALEEDGESDEGEPENRKGKAKDTPKGPRAIKKTFLDLLSEQMDRVTTLHKLDDKYAAAVLKFHEKMASEQPVLYHTHGTAKYLLPLHQDGEDSMEGRLMNAVGTAVAADLGMEGLLDGEDPTEAPAATEPPVATENHDPDATMVQN